MRRRSDEEKIKRLILRRRRSADRAARRRAERYGVECVDISRDEIRARDGETCYLCGLFVSVHEMTIDHVFPITLGGSHTPENVRIVHGVCNSRKGDRLLSELNLSEF